MQMIVEQEEEEKQLARAENYMNKVLMAVFVNKSVGNVSSAGIITRSCQYGFQLCHVFKQ